MEPANATIERNGDSGRSYGPWGKLPDYGPAAARRSVLVFHRVLLGLRIYLQVGAGHA
jgi:hypothetical protein